MIDWLIDWVIVSGHIFSGSCYPFIIWHSPAFLWGCSSFPQLCRSALWICFSSCVCIFHICFLTGLLPPWHSPARSPSFTAHWERMTNSRFPHGAAGVQITVLIKRRIHWFLCFVLFFLTSSFFGLAQWPPVYHSLFSCPEAMHRKAGCVTVQPASPETAINWLDRCFPPRIEQPKRIELCCLYFLAFAEDWLLFLCWVLLSAWCCDSGMCHLNFSLWASKNN